MQVFLLVGFIFFSLVLAGCSSGGMDSSSSVSNQDVPVSKLEYLPSGSIISFNPEGFDRFPASPSSVRLPF